MRSRSGSWFATLPCPYSAIETPDEPDLGAAHVRERAAELDPALSQRLHFRAGEDDAGLESVQELVVVPRTTVVRDRLDSGRSGHGGDCRYARRVPVRDDIARPLYGEDRERGDLRD